MNNKEAIIQKIIDDANAAAQKNLDEAREKAAQIIGRAQKPISTSPTTLTEKSSFIKSLFNAEKLSQVSIARRFCRARKKPS